MSISIDWDETEAESKEKIAREARSKAILLELSALDSIDLRMTELKAQAKDIEANLLASLCPEAEKSPGEWTHVVGDRVITIKRGERWSWDTEKLEAKFGLEPPDYVKRTYGCDKRKFEKLEEEQKNEIIDALTIGLGALSITSKEVKA